MLVRTLVQIFALFFVFVQFAFDHFFFNLNIIILFSGLVFVIYDWAKGKVEWVGFLFFAFSFLPFIHLLSYVSFDYNYYHDRVWGLISNPYNNDEYIVNYVTATACVGFIGMYLGMAASNKFYKCGREFDTPFFSKSMPLYIWLIWLILGVLFMAISAPSETVFTAKYTMAGSISRDLNFSSAWLVGLIILVFAGVDAHFQSNSIVRLVKTRLFFFSVCYSVLFLQLMRGDRESIPFFLGYLSLLFVWQRPRYSWLRFSKKTNLFILFSFLAVSFAFFVGKLRSKVEGIGIEEVLVSAIVVLGSEELGLDYWLKGTWTAVLLTPFSTIGDYIKGLTEFNFGVDYFNLVVSIVPGFIADWIGYIRPIGAGTGPATEMRYGLGGTHFFVLPFRAFGVFGVLLISTLTVFFLSLIHI